MDLPRLTWINQDSPYLRQYRQGFRLLKFDGGLEAEYVHYHAHTYLQRMRGALLVAILLMAAFVLLDFVSLPESFRYQSMAIRLGLIMPVLLLLWMATFRSSLLKHLQWMGGIAALVSGVGINGVIWLARSNDFALPYEGLILITMFFYFLTGLRFLVASFCGWLTFVGYLLVEIQAGLPREILTYNAVFLGTANVIGSVGSYFFEYAARQNFLGRGLLQDMAEKDFLTGLLNRRAFSERGEHSWRRAVREHQGLAVVMMDVDFFKRYNDHYGHAAGDKALQAVAKVIGEQARRPLDVTARYGGEEFVGLWYGLTEAQVLKILERTREQILALNIAHEKSEAAEVLSISIGLAYLQPQSYQRLEDALRIADVALYLAKEQGRNRVVSKTANGVRG